MKRIFILSLFFFRLQTGNAQKPLPSNMFTEKLENGLEVLVVEDNTVPLATVEIAVRNGAYTEEPEYNGLSHLYEHMFFKANKDYHDQGAFLDRTQELGIAFNGNTTDEKVNYYFTLPKYNLRDGLELMNSAIRYPSFDKSEMKRENVVVDAEFQRQESNPFFALNDAMNHHLWGDLFSRKNPGGDHGIINSATPEKMENIKNKYYWPNNALLVVAGDVDHQAVFGEVEKIFGNWQPSGFDPFEKYPIPEFRPIIKNDYFIVDSKNAQVPILLFQWQGPDTRHDLPNTYVADIFSFILQQNSSKIHQALVESGLALQFNANYLTEKHTGPISFLIVPNPSRIQECVAAFKQQLALLVRDDYFTDEQLALSKRLYGIRQVREQEQTSQFVQTLAYWWCSASIDYFNTYLDNLNKVTRQDIRKYVQQYIDGKPYCAGLLISPGLRTKVSPESFFKPD